MGTRLITISRVGSKNMLESLLGDIGRKNIEISSPKKNCFYAKFVVNIDLKSSFSFSL